MKGLWALSELYCDYRQSDTMKPSTYITLPYMYRLYSALTSATRQTCIVSGEGREDDSRNRSHFYVNDLR